MADKKTTIIIKKKKGGGHGGAHGGAWKVAYADFVTAMMCFFLVMWLMGSDEETKSAVAHYFNHPNTPYKAGRDPASDTTSPLGEQDGSGDLMLKGQEGAVPEDMVKDPGRKASGTLGENRDTAELIKESMDGKISSMEVNVESIRFSIPETVLFERGETELGPHAKKYLARIEKFLKKYPGYVTVAGHSDDKTPNSFEFTMARAVSVMNYMIANHAVSEDRITPAGSGARRSLANNHDSEGREKNRRIEFVLSRNKPF